ncbi:MAG TPA: hypothetical protein VK689_21730, partial [Armatimonadota bacterium]|nr:hypothetical protein [Armatimonadota bacterium]
TQQTLSFLYPKSWSYSEADRAFLATIREMEKPYPQRKPVRHPNEPMAKILVPVGETLGVVLARKDAYLRLLRLELALQEYRKRHGRYPATLAQLSPEIMTAVPLDPFTERPLVYRPQGSAYSLYSLGPDQRDDGGIPAPPRNLGPKTHGDFVAGRLGPQRIGAPPAPPPRRATQ